MSHTHHGKTYYSQSEHTLMVRLLASLYRLRLTKYWPYIGFAVHSVDDQMHHQMYHQIVMISRS